MKFLPEVGPGHNLLEFGGDLDYDLDPGSGLQSRSRIGITIRIISRFFHAIFNRGVSRPKDQSIKFGDDPDYDPDLGHSPSKKQKKNIHNKNIYYITANYSTTAIFFNKQENNMVTSLPYLLDL